MSDAPPTPSDSPLTMEEAIASPVYRDLSTAKLRTGGASFDFELPLLDSETGDTVRLSDFVGAMPVALVFGSYTWPPFRRQLGVLEDMHERYAGRVAFFVVYIKEAHPEDGWVLSANRQEQIAVEDPVSLDARAQVAEACAVRLHIRMPVLLDAIGNEVARQYGAWPDRLYLIDRDGRIAYQGDEGPFGFLPDRLEAAIEAELAAERQ